MVCIVGTISPCGGKDLYNGPSPYDDIVLRGGLELRKAGQGR